MNIEYVMPTKPDKIIYDFYLLSALYQLRNNIQVKTKHEYNLINAMEVYVTTFKKLLKAEFILIFNTEYLYNTKNKYTGNYTTLLKLLKISKAKFIANPAIYGCLVAMYDIINCNNIDENILKIDKFYHIQHLTGNMCDKFKLFEYNKFNWVVQILEYKSNITILWELWQYASMLCKQLTKYFIKHINGCYDNAKLKLLDCNLYEHQKQFIIWGTDITNNCWYDIESAFKNKIWLKGEFHGGKFIDSKWVSGKWVSGVWKYGEIYDPSLNKFVYSEVNPNIYFKNKKLREYNET